MNTVAHYVDLKLSDELCTESSLFIYMTIYHFIEKHFIIHEIKLGGGLRVGDILDT